MDDELMCESLMKWVNTFEGIKAPHRTVEELTDGVALCECLAEIAPDWFDDEWISKIRHDTGDNRRLKVEFMTRMAGYSGHPVMEALCYHTMDGTNLAFDWSGQVSDYS